MRLSILILLGLCGCLDDALTAADGDVGDSGVTICEKSATGKKSIIWDEESLQVECLEDYGGGWLLVGRSGRTQDETFGWLASQGTLDDPSRTYSLGADLKFIDVLVVAGSSGRVAFQEFSEVIEIQLPSEDFIAENSLKSVRPVQVLSYSEDCRDSIPSAFNALGHTSLTSVFWFGETDRPAEFTTGMYADEWRLDGSSCQRDGNLGGRDGAIYVRALKARP